MDFADGEGHLEKFCARFKTSEMAAEFHKAVEDAKAFVPQFGAAPAPAAKAQEPTEAKVESLAAKFAPAAGSWTCGSCYVSNSAGVVRCAACETLKPGAEVAAADAAPQAPAAQFKFGVPSAPSSGFKFGVPAPAATVAESSATTVVSVAPAQFSFGVPAPAPVEVPTAASAAAPAKLTFGVSAAAAPAPVEVSTVSSAAAPAQFSYGVLAPAPAPVEVATAASTAAPSKFSFGVPVAPASVPDSALAAGPIAAPKFSFTPSSTPAAPIKFGVASPPKQEEAAKPNSALFNVPAAAPAAKTESGGFVFGSAASLATPELKLNTPPATSTTSTLGQESTTLASILAAPTPAPSAGMTFGLAKPSFSFSIPGALASGKAPFSFSPPKPLATNGKADCLLPAEQPKVAAVAAPFGVFSFSSLTPSKEVVKAEEKIEVKDSLAPPEQPKITLGGFSFSSAPTLAPAKDDKAEEKKAEVKSSPFSGFVFKGFGSPAVTAEAAAPSKPAAAESGGMLFSMLAKSVPGAGFPVTTNQEFPGTGSKLFSAPYTEKKADEDAEEDGAGEGEEYEPSATFEPVVPLPALVDVASGEEDEKVLFSERAFLYRFAAETKEWKEKGRGDMKILEHNVTGRTRLLMRREQVSLFRWIAFRTRLFLSLDFGKCFLNFGKCFLHFGKCFLDFGKCFLDFGKCFLDFGKCFLDFGKFFLDFGKCFLHFGKCFLDFGKCFLHFGKCFLDFGKFFLDFGKCFLHFGKCFLDFGKCFLHFGKCFLHFGKCFLNFCNHFSTLKKHFTDLKKMVAGVEDLLQSLHNIDAGAEAVAHCGAHLELVGQGLFRRGDHFGDVRAQIQVGGAL